MRALAASHRTNVEPDLILFMDSLATDEMEGIADYISRMTGPIKDRARLHNDGSVGLKRGVMNRICNILVFVDPTVAVHPSVDKAAALAAKLNARLNSTSAIRAPRARCACWSRTSRKPTHA